MINSYNKVFVISQILVNGAIGIIAFGINWFITSSTSKVITDNCKSWVKNQDNSNATDTWFLDATKQEICKWSPFVSDIVISATIGQATGMIMVGADFRIWKPLSTTFGKSGVSKLLYNCFGIFQQNENYAFSLDEVESKEIYYTSEAVTYFLKDGSAVDLNFRATQLPINHGYSMHVVHESLRNHLGLIDYTYAKPDFFSEDVV